MSFNEYWDQEGERLLGENNKIPTVKERARDAYAHGLADGIEQNLSFRTTQPIMKHDLLDLIEYHKKKVNSYRVNVVNNHWEEGEKDKYRFHVRSLQLLQNLERELFFGQ
jgi:hypothetical protein